MPKPKDARNQQRAYEYVTQALEHYRKLDTLVTVPSDEVGRWVSLGRNLESAQADLTPPTEGES